MEDEFDIDNFQDFVDAFLEGKLKPYLKSEPVPRFGGILLRYIQCSGKRIEH